MGQKDIAINTLLNEFIEVIFIVPMFKHCYEVLEHEQEMLIRKEKILMMKDMIINQLLMEVKENVVDSLAIPIGEMMKWT
ncbi:MAG: hypothetical protein QGH39_07490 [Candidatus Thermoplasmatota archaeon]|jgi:hypothetical protein|nr:hypothetical protein [Candidatus Thermoplasmatota archaeon]MDP7265388.1 hypothetical protein [Candidatus Thermoplasmatota archaeon]